MGSVGRVIPGGKLWIEGHGQTREICYQGENVFVGYAERTQDLAECPAPAPRVLHTGDMGYLDFFDTAEVYGTPENPHQNEMLPVYMPEKH